MMTKMTKPTTAVLAFGLTTLLAGTAMAGAPPQAKCAAAKQKAVAKKEKGILSCRSKDAATPDPTALQACIDGVVAKFAPAFGKADAKGACVGDPAVVEPQVDNCADAVVSGIPINGGMEKCGAAKIKAAGGAASAKVNCYAKATGKGGHCSVDTKTPCLNSQACPSGQTCVFTPVDQPCLQKASGKLSSSFAKADLKGTCPGTGTSTDAVIDQSCVSTITNGLPGQSPNVCGNGVIEASNNETCDDGNALDGDGCPASCHVDSCTPVTPSSFGAHVTWSGGPPATTISGLGIFVDYPEGKVSQPVAANSFGVAGSLNNLGYGFNDNLIKTGGLPSTLMSLTFKTCQGAPAAVQGDFNCVVTDASDDDGNVVDPSTITCTVTVP